MTRATPDMTDESRELECNTKLPPWALLHIPHDATAIPSCVQYQFALDKASLRQELRCMTDFKTYRMFAPLALPVNIIRSPVSRLVIDVERFADDALEAMAAVGMGAVYLRTSTGAALRYPLSDTVRAELLHDYYYPHHLRLESRALALLQAYGRLLILDCHSFASIPLPHEHDQTRDRPAICIGVDSFHTPAALVTSLTAAFNEAGFDVAVNHPFSGAMVPAALYRVESRAVSVMIEVNRRLYMHEQEYLLRTDFPQVAAAIRSACKAGIDQWVGQNVWIPQGA